MKKTICIRGEMITMWCKTCGKRTERFLSILLVALLLCGCFPVAASERAGGEGATHVLENNGDLLSLIASDAVRDGDTIVLQGTADVNDPDSNSAPWVINKAVTIQGGTVNLRAGGILLGADVSFDGTTLAFPNRIRNAIMANGHTLTLNNVSQDSSTNEVHLFCGGLTGHEVNADAGTHGEIIIKGSTSLGNVYAGSMSANGAGNEWNIPSSIVIDGSATGKLGTVYACGALETPVDENEMFNPSYVVDAPKPNAEGFRVTAPVHIALWQSVVKTVEGTTGGDENASVTYNGNGNLSTPALSNIRDLTVESGNLAPQSSSLFGDVAVAHGAILDLRGFGDVFTVADFIGGGTLGLGEEQTLTISGTVEGVTTVGIGDIFNGASQGLIDNDHIYIVAKKSEGDSFTLLPPWSDPGAVFVRDENGSWTIPTVEIGKIVVEDAGIEEKITAESGSILVELPVSVSYAAESDLDCSCLAEIPVGISVNGEETCSEYDKGFVYTFSDSSVFSIGLFMFGDESEVLYLESKDVITDGKYIVTITIPAEFMADGKELKLSTTLVVGEQSGGEQFEISAVRSDNGVIVQLPQNLMGTKIIAAAYNGQNQMVSVSDAIVSGETVVLPVTGETIRVFIAGEDYIPILPVLQVS